LLTERAEARAAKDWARADALRDGLADAGIRVEDGTGGVRWSVDTERKDG
jgi:cysteinyl-tRNA synthetase